MKHLTIGEGLQMERQRRKSIIGGCIDVGIVALCYLSGIATGWFIWRYR